MIVCVQLCKGSSNDGNYDEGRDLIFIASAREMKPFRCYLRMILRKRKGNFHFEKSDLDLARVLSRSRKL